jgi:hypothetical protein
MITAITKVINIVEKLGNVLINLKKKKIKKKHR